MKDDLGGALQRVNDRMSELLKNAQGALRGERDFAAEDIRQLREMMDAMAPIVAQSYEFAASPAWTQRAARPVQISFERIAEHAGANTRDAAGASSEPACQPIAVASCGAVGDSLLADAIEQVRQEPAKTFYC